MLTNLGQIEFREGGYQQAAELYKRADVLYQKNGDEWSRGHMNHYLALISGKENKPAEALQHWQNALTLYRRTNANPDIAETLLYLVDTHQQQSSPVAEYAPLLEEAEALIEEFGFENLRDKLARLRG